mgnify:CR=1 FL=1
MRFGRRNHIARCKGRAAVGRGVHLVLSRHIERARRGRIAGGDKAGRANAGGPDARRRRQQRQAKHAGIARGLDGLNTGLIRFSRRVEGFDLTNGNGTDVDRDQYNARIDHNFNSRNKLSVIGTKEHTWGGASQSVQRSWPDGFDGIAVKRPDVYIVTFTSTLSNTLLNEFRAEIGRAHV